MVVILNMRIGLQFKVTIPGAKPKQVKKTNTQIGGLTFHYLFGTKVFFGQMFFYLFGCIV